MSHQEDNSIENFDKEVEKRLISMMQEDPKKLMQYFTLISGRELVKVNATHLDMSAEATIEGERYEIKHTIEVIKKEIKGEPAIAEEED